MKLNTAKNIKRASLLVIAVFLALTVFDFIGGAQLPIRDYSKEMAGGAFMLIAALCVMFVRDVADDVPANRMIEADEYQGLSVQQSVQPVPSTGLER